MAELTSRERVLRALHHQQPDYIPCCFMSFTALRRRCQENLYELVRPKGRWAWIRIFLFPPCRAPSGLTIRNCGDCPSGSIRRLRRE